jgi:hypothetical protein
LEQQVDLFGEKRISIPDNPTLEKVATMILNLSDHYPEMFDGNTIGEVDRKIREVVWLENGLYKILTDDGDRVKAFEKWNASPQQCVDPDLLTRARRELVSKGIVRLKASAVKQGDREMHRLSRSFGRK